MFHCKKCTNSFSSKRGLSLHHHQMHSNKLHPLIKTHHGAFKMIERASGDNYRRIIDNTPSMIKAIKKLCQLILNGNLRLDKNRIKKLKRHRNIIRKVAHKPHADIKGTIQTGGNILKSIISTVLPLITALI